jgi:hypothetical protein
VEVAVDEGVREADSQQRLALVDEPRGCGDPCLAHLGFEA